MLSRTTISWAQWSNHTREHPLCPVLPTVPTLAQAPKGGLARQTLLANDWWNGAETWMLSVQLERVYFSTERQVCVVHTRTCVPRLQSKPPNSNAQLVEVINYFKPEITKKLLNPVLVTLVSCMMTTLTTVANSTWPKAIWRHVRGNGLGTGRHLVPPPAQLGTRYLWDIAMHLQRA